MTANDIHPAVGDKIREFIEERFPLVVARSLDNDASLLESGAIDSMGFLDIVGFLEDEFAVEIEDDDITPENFESISQIERFVARKNG